MLFFRRGERGVLNNRIVVCWICSPDCLRQISPNRDNKREIEIEIEIHFKVQTSRKILQRMNKNALFIWKLTCRKRVSHSFNLTQSLSLSLSLII